jgi:uncharacterized protein YjbI with pentapeptide repeats
MGGRLSTRHSLALRRLLAWGLEVSLLAGSAILPWGLGEAIRQDAKADLVPLNPVSTLVQKTLARPLGLPRYRQPVDVPPLTNLLWFSALLFPVTLAGVHLHGLAKTGKTWPKSWLGLQVVTRHNAIPGYATAALREGVGRLGLPLGIAYILWLGSGAFPALPALAGLALTSGLLLGATGLSNRSGRACHDYLAGTHVLLLWGGQLPSKHEPEATSATGHTVQSLTTLAAGRLPFQQTQLFTVTDEDGGLRALVLSPLEEVEHAKQARPWWRSGTVSSVGGLAGLLALAGLVGMLLHQLRQPSSEATGQQRDRLFLALVENLSLNATTFSDQQAAALALASSEDPRAIPLLVDLLAQTGDPALLDTLQQALVTLGPPAIPHLQRLNLTLANDVMALPPDQRLIPQLRQRTVKRTLAKILVLHSGQLNGVNLSGTNLGYVIDSPDAFTLVLEQQHLAGLLWSNAVLSGARFRKAIFFNPGADGRPDTFDDWITDFSGSDLTEASLVAAQLRHAILRNTSLLRANLSNAQADYADFSGANASSAWLISAEINHGRFQGTSLVGADLTNAQLNHAHFAEARLAHAILAGASLNQADLTHADLSNADLSQASLQRASLKEANLTSSQLAQADLSYANLENANLRNVDLQGAVLTGARLAGASLGGANFFTTQPPQTGGFITTMPDRADSLSLVGVDFSKALGLQDEQLNYICQQGGIHPLCRDSR